MKIGRKLILFITPSWISTIGGIIISASYIAVTALALSIHNGRLAGFKLSDYLQTGHFKDSEVLLRTTISSVRFTSIFFILFWVIVGFITYSIVFAFKDSMDESLGFMHQLKYINAKPKLMSMHVLIRSMLIFLSIILWIIFGLTFSWLVLPNSLNLINKSITNGQSPFYVFASFGIFLIATHIAVILLRFTLLRTRLTKSGQ